MTLLTGFRMFKPSPQPTAETKAGPVTKGTIRRKLLFLATSSVSLALLLSCSLFVTHGFVTMRRAMDQQIVGQARLLALNSAAAVEFGDSVQADRLLDALEGERLILAAGLYDITGNIVGGYPSREHARAVFQSPELQDQTDTTCVLVELVKLDGEAVGNLRLQIDSSPISTAMNRYFLVAGLVGIGAWAVAVAVAIVMQRQITNPIRRLAEVARAVTQDRNYSLRASTNKSRDVDGELRELFIAFDEMLDEVESSKKELQESQKTLELRVQQRTAELAKARDAAEAASRAKSNFLANMSHEIRTPLNAIMGYADMLRRGWDDTPEERNEMLSTVHASGRHLMTVINDILDLSKIESGRLELELRPESPHQVLSEVVSLMRVPFQEKHLTLDYTWEGPIPVQIETDGQRLRQILINLLGNARKFTRVGGVQLIARVRNEDHAEPKLVVDVIDSGIGIPRDKQDQIFEPFIQADTSVTRRYGGTGLGLSISRRLARMMDGDLVVNSDPGRGSSFRLTVATGSLNGVSFVPSTVASDLLPSRSTTNATAQPRRLDGMHVLVVDDGETNRRMISLLLKRAGARVSLTENGQLACDILLSRHDVHVVLMDMQMPVLDGYLATRRLRSQGVTVPIIALTAHAMKGDREECLAAGCTDYLTKPVNADELFERLHQLQHQSLDGYRESAVVAPQERITSELPLDDPEFVEIVRDYVESLTTELNRMQDAVNARDAAAVGRLAHWLKGSGGTAGFPCFTNPAAQLGVVAAAGQWPEAEQLMQMIRNLRHRLETPMLVTESSSTADHGTTTNAGVGTSDDLHRSAVNTRNNTHHSGERTFSETAATPELDLLLEGVNQEPLVMVADLTAGTDAAVPTSSFAQPKPSLSNSQDRPGASR
jgi:two-component system, sensor histidine kinase